MKRVKQPRLLRVSEVEYYTGLSRTTIRRRVAEGEFPAPIISRPWDKTAPHLWRHEDVQEWLSNLPRVADVGSRSNIAKYNRSRES